MIEQLPVPERATALRLLPHVDYQDAFGLTTPVRRTPQEWARLALADAPPLVRGIIRQAHRALGLRLAPPDAPDHVLGWAILQSGPEVLVLGADGDLGTPRIVILTSPGNVVFATLLRFGGVRARIAWMGIAPLHRAVARYLVGRMARLDSTVEQPAATERRRSLHACASDQALSQRPES